MKKTIKYALSAVFVFCLVFCIVTVSAFAETYSCNVGEAFPQTPVFNASGDIVSYKLSYGSLPSGMSFTAVGPTVYLSGVPSAGGTYECAYWLETVNGWEDFSVTVNVNGDPFADPAATAAPVAAGSAPVIKKHPTGEKVEVGGTAKFIARADNATSITWRIVSADTTNTIKASEAPSFFDGVTVSGLDSDTLVLSNIPKSMNGWNVEAKFTGPGGTSYSNGAAIKVVDDINAPAVTAAPATKTKDPVIDTKPQPASGTVGDGLILTVGASSPDNGTLKYQWYSSPTDNKATIVSVEGATDSAFMPPQNPGVTYYCVAVTNSLNGKDSTAVYSDLVPVEYKAAAATPAPTAQTTDPSFGGVSNGPSVPANPTGQTTDNGRYSGSGINTSVIFFGITGLLAIAAIVIIIVFIKRSGSDEDE